MKGLWIVMLVAAWWSLSLGAMSTKVNPPIQVNARHANTSQQKHKRRSCSLDITRTNVGLTEDLKKELLLTGVRNNNCELVSDLIFYKNADPYTRTDQGLTPLHVAVRLGLDEMVWLLVRHIWVAVDVVDDEKNRQNPLHYAADHGFVSIAQILLGKDTFIGNDSEKHRCVFINARDGKGRTALFIATERKHEQMVRFLLDQGADVLIKDQRGLIAEEAAETDEIRALLHRAGPERCCCTWM